MSMVVLVVAAVATALMLVINTGVIDSMMSDAAAAYLN